MNFERTNSKISLLEDFYSHFNEADRLKKRHGQVEFRTNIIYISKYINKYLEDNNKKDVKLLDIGCGTGAYSGYLNSDKVKVVALDLVSHNLEILKKHYPSVDTVQGNATDLSMFKNESFDIVILFGPMYHLLKEEEKLKALTEAKKVLKPNGILFTSYYMNDYAILTYGFMKQNILDSINERRVDENFHVINTDDDLFSMVRLEDINHFNEVVGLKRLQIIASDGPADYIRTTLNKLTKEEFEVFIKYHLSTCERVDLLGASSHLLDICVKEENNG